MNTTLNIGLAGLGTVGGGLVRLLSENAEEIRARSGCDFNLKAVAVRNPNRKRDLPEGVRLTTDPMTLADDPDIDVVIELMGGIDTAKELITRSLAKGKQVVTANKALLAEEGESLFRLADEKGATLLYEASVAGGIPIVQGKQVVTANKALLAEEGESLFRLADEKGATLLYEASVAGGIPIVQTLKESLTGNRITSLEGILNGTGNYILSEMTSKGVSFAPALAEAQEKGYAEADPTLDIDGFDTAHKLVLLIRLAWGVDYPYTKMPIEGIRNLDKMDIDFAREFGYRIKLLGRARMRDGKLEAGVFPTLVNHTYLLARVGGAYNAVRVEGNAVGSLFLHGLGAGSLPTASAGQGRSRCPARPFRRALRSGRQHRAGNPEGTERSGRAPRLHDPRSLGFRHPQGHRDHAQERFPPCPGYLLSGHGVNEAIGFGGGTFLEKGSPPQNPLPPLPRLSTLSNPS